MRGRCKIELSQGEKSHGTHRAELYAGQLHQTNRRTSAACILEYFQARRKPNESPRASYNRRVVMKNPAGTTRLLRRSRLGRESATFCLLALACSHPLRAQTTASIDPPPEVVSTTHARTVPTLSLPDCIISADDVLMISVYEAPDVTGEYRVSPTGEIQVPLLNAPIVAAGQTPEQLSELIVGKYRAAEIYSHPRITVAIKESRVHAIAIAGAVKKPQIYPVFGKITLLDLLVAGGRPGG